MYHDSDYPTEKEMSVALASQRARLHAEGERPVPSTRERCLEAQAREALRQIAKRHFPKLSEIHSGLPRVIAMAASEFCCELMNMDYRYRKGYGSEVRKLEGPKKRTGRKQGKSS